MAGITHGHAAAGFEEGGDDRRCERSGLRQGRELLVEEPNKLGLIQAIDEAPHQRAQVGRGGGDGNPVPRDIRQQQTGDTARRATGRVVDIASVLGIAVGFAVHPRVQTAEGNAFLGELAAAPDFHALHPLLGLFAHAGFYPAYAYSVSKR